MKPGTTIADRFVLGSDAGVSQKYAYGFAEHHEIAMYVRFGMTPAEAIQVSTSRPTEVLHIKDAGTLRTTMTKNIGRIDAANLRRAHAIVESGRALGKIVLEGFG